MNFLKRVLSTLVGLIIFSLIGILIFFLIISGLTKESEVVVEENTVLHLKLDKPISEVAFNNAFEDVFPSAPSTIGLVQVKEAISYAKEDENIKGIYLEAPYLITGMAITQEIRESLADFKRSGKFVVAYSEFYTEQAYYLASVADKLFLHPEGDLEFNGLAANVTFLKGMFDKLEIEPQIFRVGEFKSAVEPLMRKDMSEENRLQLSDLLSSMYGNMLDSIGRGRKISLERLKEISSEMLARSPEEAFEMQLVDSLYYFDQVIASMKAKCGLTKADDLTLIKHEKYNKSYSSYKRSDNEIAVIVGSGDIVSGKGDANTIGSDRYAKEIRKAREDDDIKAIVLRINSPGGSFIASDVIWREVKLAAESKPIIASMSDMATSGGYYMAMGCDTIVAQPTTITGSIGIFGVLFNAKGFLNNKLGITHDEVSTGKFSNLISMTKPLTEQEKRIIQNEVEKGYQTFVNKAAKGRGMKVEAVQAIASGRVWTGIQAKENGLVDILGDLNKAIEIAAASAEVKDYRVRYFPKQKSLIEQILKDFEGETQAKVLKNKLGDYYHYLDALESVQHMQGLQARWPFEIKIN
ncbi:MAG: signal peptide peptidase SppA [Fulvivirga sp.]|nr:signal peptide peptidase SppA [Fulvivirga sp.]